MLTREIAAILTFVFSHFADSPRESEPDDSPPAAQEIVSLPADIPMEELDQERALTSAFAEDATQIPTNLDLAPFPPPPRHHDHDLLIAESQSQSDNVPTAAAAPAAIVSAISMFDGDLEDSIEIEEGGISPPRSPPQQQLQQQPSAVSQVAASSGGNSEDVFSSVSKTTPSPPGLQVPPKLTRAAIAKQAAGMRAAVSIPETPPSRSRPTNNVEITLRKVRKGENFDGAQSPAPKFRGKVKPLEYDLHETGVDADDDFFESAPLAAGAGVSSAPPELDLGGDVPAPKRRKIDSESNSDQITANLGLGLRPPRSESTRPANPPMLTLPLFDHDSMDVEVDVFLENPEPHVPPPPWERTRSLGPPGSTKPWSSSSGPVAIPAQELVDAPPSEEGGWIQQQPKQKRPDMPSKSRNKYKSKLDDALEQDLRPNVPAIAASTQAVAAVSSSAASPPTVRAPGHETPVQDTLAETPTNKRDQRQDSQAQEPVEPIQQPTAPRRSTEPRRHAPPLRKEARPPEAKISEVVRSQKNTTLQRLTYPVKGENPARTKPYKPESVSLEAEDDDDYANYAPKAITIRKAPRKYLTTADLYTHRNKK